MYSRSRFRCVYHQGRVEKIFLKFAESVVAYLHIDTSSQMWRVLSGTLKKKTPHDPPYNSFIYKCTGRHNQSTEPRGKPGL